MAILIRVGKIIQTMAELQEHTLYFINVGQLTMAHMFQYQLLNQVHKVITIQHSFAVMALAHFSILIHEFLKKDPDIVPEECLLIILDGKSAVLMYNNGKDTEHTRNIARRMNFVSNG